MNKLLKKELNKLANFTPTDFPFISLYLNTQANQHGRDDFESFVRKEFSEQAKKFADDSPELKSFEHDRYWINEYLSEKLRPSANGVAIFACAGANNFFEVIELDAPIHKHSMHITNSPHLYPLARLIDQNPRHVALVADTDSARLFVFDPGVIKSIHLLQNTEEITPRNGEMSQIRFQKRLENQRLLHAKNIVEMLKRVVKTEEINHIILAGDEVIIPLLKDQLPQELNDKLVDVLRLDIKTPEHEVLKATTEALIEHNIENDALKVRELFDRYESGGLGVVGLDDTLHALSKGQVDELFLSASLKDIITEAPELLKVPSISAISNKSIEDREKWYSPNIIDKLISRTLLTGASINFIEDPLLLSDFGGVGAFLRYREYSLAKGAVGQNVKAESRYAN